MKATAGEIADFLASLPRETPVVIASLDHRRSVSPELYAGVVVKKERMYLTPYGEFGRFKSPHLQDRNDVEVVVLR